MLSVRKTFAVVWWNEEQYGKVPYTDFLCFLFVCFSMGRYSSEIFRACRLV